MKAKLNQGKLEISDLQFKTDGRISSTGKTFIHAYEVENGLISLKDGTPVKVQVTVTSKNNGFGK